MILTNTNANKLIAELLGFNLGSILNAVI